MKDSEDEINRSNVKKSMENGGLDRLSPDQLRQIREAGLIEL